MSIWITDGTRNGLVPDADGHVSVLDHGFTVADGVFETMKTVNGCVFAWDLHLQRLHTSANLLGIELPADELLTRAVIATARDNAERSGQLGRLRITVTSGIGPLGSERGDTAPTVVVAAAPMGQWPAAADVVFADSPRNERSPLVHAKSTSYAENVRALRLAHQRDAGEALFLNTHGVVTEGTGSNVFIVSSGEVVTPPLVDGLLPGITRALVLSLASEQLPISEATITRADLENADEVFLTSSTRDIQAVRRIEDRAYPRHDVTTVLAGRLRTLAADPSLWS